MSRAGSPSTRRSIATRCRRVGRARCCRPPAAPSLDVGCGGGRSSLPLVPPASELIGVDRSGAMLDEFVAAASTAGVARRTVHGGWPDVAGHTPARRRRRLPSRAVRRAGRRAVRRWRSGPRRLGGRRRDPDSASDVGVVAGVASFLASRTAGRVRPIDDLVAVLDELGLAARVHDEPTRPRCRRMHPIPTCCADGAAPAVPSGRPRCGARPSGWPTNPLPWPDTVATIRWPGPLATPHVRGDDAVDDDCSPDLTRCSPDSGVLVACRCCWPRTIALFESRWCAR